MVIFRREGIIDTVYIFTVRTSPKFYVTSKDKFIGFFFFVFEVSYSQIPQIKYECINVLKFAMPSITLKRYNKH